MLNPTLRNLIIATAITLVGTPAAADPMLHPQTVAKVLKGSTFTATARNGTVGLITFNPDGHLTFKGLFGNPRKDDRGVYRLTGTGYCSKWRSTMTTRCFTLSQVKGPTYQLWTIEGQKVDRFTRATAS